MTAWEWLVEGSELSTGDAWTLLTHPRQGGGGNCLVTDEVRISQKRESLVGIGVEETPVTVKSMDRVIEIAVEIDVKQGDDDGVR